MKPCPFCAEEIQEAAIRCKHCRSDLVAIPHVDSSPAADLPRVKRPGRRLVAGVFALLALLGSGVVLSRTVSHAVRTSACQPASWGEWHAAIRKHCLDPSYVCQHMTTAKLLEDPELVNLFERNVSRVADVVERMRDAYGCAPERAPVFRPGLPEPGPLAPPAFPPQQDVPRTI
jgi:hypothetical protein